MSTVLREDFIEESGTYHSCNYGFPSMAPQAKNAYYSGGFNDCNITFTYNELILKIIFATDILQNSTNAYTRNSWYGVGISVFLESMDMSASSGYISGNDSLELVHKWQYVDLIIPSSLSINGIVPYTKNMDHSQEFYQYHLWWYNNGFNSSSGLTFSNAASKIKAALQTVFNNAKTTQKFASHYVAVVAREIGRYPAKTKKYTNTTWNTSKTWYIKVTFSRNKYSYEDTNTGNVVNYETMIQKYILLLYTNLLKSL